MLKTPYYDALDQAIKVLGGYRNAHLHLDRTGTLDVSRNLLSEDVAGEISTISLQKKHSLISQIHESKDYEASQLDRKLTNYVSLMASFGTSAADSLIDVTDDSLGLTAIHAAQEVRERFRGSIEFNIASYNPLGFRDDSPRRWQLFEEAARVSQFIGLLPERDDQARYPNHIGFDEVCRRSMELAISLDKPLHIHVDQANVPEEAGAERVLRLYEEMGALGGNIDEPKLWLIHVISPSAYDESRHQELVSQFRELNVGLVVCPSAAISMRQIRGINAPTHNSIARVLEFLAEGVHVRIGSDNIHDITSPAGTPNLLAELYVLAHALRFFDIPVLAHLGAGHRLGAAEIEMVRSHLEQDRLESSQAQLDWESRGLV